MMSKNDVLPGTSVTWCKVLSDPKALSQETCHFFFLFLFKFLAKYQLSSFAIPTINNRTIDNTTHSLLWQSKTILPLLFTGIARRWFSAIVQLLSRGHRSLNANEYGATIGGFSWLSNTLARTHSY